MSKQRQSPPERDSDYYRRLGGYMGPSRLKAAQVGCPTCEAVPGDPCQNAKGVMKGLHQARHNYAIELNHRANADDSSTARWWRREFREGRIPKPPKPCGTFAAYQRHKRNGEVIDDACATAAREHWRLAKASA